jgi:DNA-damage-inducible protein J
MGYNFIINHRGEVGTMNPERKTAEVKARIEPSLKKAAEKYLKHYDISASHGIKLFFQAVVDAKGLPFDLRPSKETKEAMAEHKTGNLKTYSSYDDMMADIDSEDEEEAEVRQHRTK